MKENEIPTVTFPTYAVKKNSKPEKKLQASMILEAVTFVIPV